MKNSHKLLIALSFTKALFSADDAKSFDFNTYVLHDDVKPKDYQYQALGLPNEEKSLKKVSTAYKKLVVKHHPDKGGNPDIFQKIDHSYKNITEWIAFKIEANDPEYIAAQEESAEQKQARLRAEIAQMNEAQIKAIPLSQVANFTIEDLELLLSIGALTIDQTKALNPLVISDLSYDIANFQPDQIKAFTPAQIAAITADQIVFLNKEQIQNLEISKISPETFLLLAGNKTAGKTELFTDNQIKSLNSEQLYELFRIFTEDQIKAITQIQINRLKDFQKDQLNWRKELLAQRKQNKEAARLEQERINREIEELRRKEQEKQSVPHPKTNELATQALALSIYLR